ncbi:MAG TPA: polysaccharide biosynthesis C-terminal domain-containing protein, partial [Flavobacterium sp.]
EEYITYYLIIVLVQAAVAFSNMHKIGWKGFLPKFSIESLPVKSLWHFFLSSSIISIYVFFDVLILGWIAEEKNVGYYTVAIRIVKLSLLMVLSLNVILFPRISHLRSNSNNDVKVKGLIEKSMQFILVLTIPIFAGFYFLAPQIISILAGDGFAPSVFLVQILSVLPVIIGFSNLFVYQIITPFGKEKQLLICVFITCVVSLLLHVVFAHLWSERGTAVATICTELLMTVLTAMVAFRTLRIHFPVATMLQAIAAVAPFILIVLFFQNHIHNPWLLTFGCGFIGIAIYAAIQLFVFRNELVTEVVSELKRFNRRLVNE